MPFEIKLKLQNDPSLRSYIKTLLRGQIKSVTREDVRAALLPELVNKTYSHPESIKEYLEKILKEEIDRCFKKATNSYYGSQDSLHSYMKQCVKEEVRKMINKQLKGKKLTLEGVE